MKKLVFILVFCMMSTSVFAEDEKPPIFDQLEELITRVESGISLNTFAKTYSKWKIDYKNIILDPSQDDPSQDNLLRDDRMKDVFDILDVYVDVWKAQEQEHRKYLTYIPRYAKDGANTCIILDRDIVIYSIACIKDIILTSLKQKVVSAKSAHINGW
jgi:hypothetical protein